MRGITPGINSSSLPGGEGPGRERNDACWVSGFLFFNQINHVLAENNFCLLMASPAFEVPHGTAGFEVGSEKRTSLFV